MLRLIKNKNSQELILNNHRFLLINEWNENIVHSILEYDALMITAQNNQSFETIVERIRTDDDMYVFLKPLFYKHDVSSSHVIHTDGKLDELTSETIISTINQKITAIKTNINRTNSFEESISNRFLQYIFTRNAEIIPQKNRTNKLGYAFPFINLFHDEESLKLFTLFNKIEKDQLITGTLKDQVQLCNPCHDSFLVYKETCPKCNSIDITPQDIIHHFVCAHVAPEEDFKVEGSDEMECPKCTKSLRHIGIDYDKPSAVYHCNNCSNDFQNATVMAECHSCNHQNQLDELTQVSIKKYTLTMKGIQTIQQGFDTKRKESTNANSFFYQLVKHESKRHSNSNPTCFVGTLSMEDELLNRLNDSYRKKLESEVKSIVNQYVEEENHQAIENGKRYVLFFDQTQQEAEAALSMLENNLALLFKNNLYTNLNIKSSLQAITQFNHTA